MITEGIMVIKSVLLFSIVLLFGAEGMNNNLDMRGLERETVERCMNTSLRELKIPYNSKKRRKYDQAVPINLRTKSLTEFSSHFDPYSVDNFLLFQRMGVYSLQDLTQADKDDFSFRILSSTAAYFNNYLTGLPRIDDSILNRIPVQYGISEKVGPGEEIRIQEDVGEQLVKDFFRVAPMTLDFSDLELAFILRLHLYPKKKYYLFIFSLPDKSDTTFYTECMSGALRSLAREEFRSQPEELENLKKYLTSEVGYDFKLSQEAQRIISLYGATSFSFGINRQEISAETEEAIQEFSAKLDGYSASQNSKIELENRHFIGLLKFVSQRDSLFHVYNPMEFWIVNLMQPKEPLPLEDRLLWRDCIAGSYKARYVVNNVSEIFPVPEQQTSEEITHRQVGNANPDDDSLS